MKDRKICVIEMKPSWCRQELWKLKLFSQRYSKMLCNIQVTSRTLQLDKIPMNIHWRKSPFLKYLIAQKMFRKHTNFSPGCNTMKILQLLVGVKVSHWCLWITVEFFGRTKASSRAVFVGEHQNSYRALGVWTSEAFCKEILNSAKQCPLVVWSRTNFVQCSGLKPLKVEPISIQLWLGLKFPTHHPILYQTTTSFPAQLKKSSRTNEILTRPAETRRKQLKLALHVSQIQFLLLFTFPRHFTRFQHKI